MPAQWSRPVLDGLRESTSSFSAWARLSLACWISSSSGERLDEASVSSSSDFWMCSLRCLSSCSAISVPQVVGCLNRRSDRIRGPWNRITFIEDGLNEQRKYGPYTLIRKIGQGGMAEVWQGRHVLLDR